MFAFFTISTYAATVLKTSLALWFAIWAIRYKGGLDHELNSGAKLLRWVTVVVAHSVVIFGSNWLKYPAIRVTVWGIGAAFLAWPNLAHYLFNVLARFRKADDIQDSRPRDIM